MQMEQFEKLSHRQKQAMIIAIHVRNSMEEFHAKNLSNKQMRQLNPIIRQAILEGLTIGKRRVALIAFHRFRRERSLDHESRMACANDSGLLGDTIRERD